MNEVPDCLMRGSFWEFRHVQLIAGFGGSAILARRYKETCTFKGMLGVCTG
jgi:hypothetical protein